MNVQVVLCTCIPLAIAEVSQEAAVASCHPACAVQTRQRKTHKPSHTPLCLPPDVPWLEVIRLQGHTLSSHSGKMDAR